MKFSQRKKAKMRKYRQRRINQTCSSVIRDIIENGYKVKDEAKINNIIYLLVQEEHHEYVIYKIVKPFEYVRLSAKKILHNRKTFSNYVYWYNHSVIQITEEGKIESVNRMVRQVVWENNKPTYVYVPET